MPSVYLPDHKWLAVGRLPCLVPACGGSASSEMCSAPYGYAGFALASLSVLLIGSASATSKIARLS